jgi:hypothetical protein
MKKMPIDMARSATRAFILNRGDFFKLRNDKSQNTPDIKNETEIIMERLIAGKNEVTSGYGHLKVYRLKRRFFSKKAGLFSPAFAITN